MKKISIILVICLIALMCLSACSTTDAEDVPAETHTVETQPVETQPVEVEETEAISTPKQLDTAYTVETVGEKDVNENGEVIGDCHYQKVVFTNPNEALAKINSEIAEECDEFFDEGMGKQYEEYLKELPDSMKADLPTYPFVATVDVKDVYIDDNYVSIIQDWDWYAGGVHNYGSTGLNFDLKTGEELDFEDLFASEADARTAFETAVNAIIDEQPEAFFDDAKETVKNYDLDGVNFSLNGKVITVYIDQYEIAPGASGAFTVVISK